MFCKFCGKQLKDNARFCSGCGKPCNPEEKQSAPAEPIAAPAIAQQAVSEEPEQQPEPCRRSPPWRNSRCLRQILFLHSRRRS